MYTNEFPNYSKEQLKNLNEGVHVFLYRHDNDWLKGYSYRVKKHGMNAVEWERKDIELLGELKEG